MRWLCSGDCKRQALLLCVSAHTARHPATAWPGWLSAAVCLQIRLEWELISQRNLCFATVVVAIEAGKLLDALERPTPGPSPGQWILVVRRSTAMSTWRPLWSRAIPVPEGHHSELQSSAPAHARSIPWRARCLSPAPRSTSPPSSSNCSTMLSKVLCGALQHLRSWRTCANLLTPLARKISSSMFDCSVVICKPSTRRYACRLRAEQFTAGGMSLQRAFLARRCCEPLIRRLIQRAESAGKAGGNVRWPATRSWQI